MILFDIFRPLAGLPLTLSRRFDKGDRPFDKSGKSIENLQ